VSDFQISEARIRELAGQESLTDEEVEDIVGAMAGRGLAYDDDAGVIAQTRRGPNPYDAAETWDEETLQLSLTDAGIKDQTVVLAREYDYTESSAVENTLDVSGNQSYPSGIQFSPDGTRMVIAGNDSPEVNQYDLSTAWDLASATDTGVTLSSAIKGLHFGDSGTMLFGVNSSDEILSWPLSTAYDIGSAGSSTTYSPSNPSYIDDVDFNGDGTKMITIGGDIDGFFYGYFELSTAWDLSTASYVDSTSFPGDYSQPAGGEAIPTGELITAANGEIQTWDWSPFSASPDLSLKKSEPIPSEMAEVRGLVYGNDGLELYLNENGTLYQVNAGLQSLNGTTYIRFDEPGAITEWDVATFDAVEDGGTIDVYVEHDDGTGWTAVGPISSNYDMSDISPSDDVRLRAELSRPDTSHDTRLNAAYLSWFV